METPRIWNLSLFLFHTLDPWCCYFLGYWFTTKHDHLLVGTGMTWLWRRLLKSWLACGASGTATSPSQTYPRLHTGKEQPHLPGKCTQTSHISLKTTPGYTHVRNCYISLKISPNFTQVRNCYISLKNIHQTNHIGEGQLHLPGKNTLTTHGHKCTNTGRDMLHKYQLNKCSDRSRECNFLPFLQIINYQPNNQPTYRHEVS